MARVVTGWDLVSKPVCKTGANLGLSRVGDTEATFVRRGPRGALAFELFAVGAAVRPSSGVLLDVAEQFVHDHGHRANHHQSREGQAHLHG